MPLSTLFLTKLNLENVVFFYQTIVRDVNSLMADPKWTDDDKAMLESQLVLAMQPRLCLDPSPKVLYTANKIQHHVNKWNHKGLRRSVQIFYLSCKDEFYAFFWCCFFIIPST